MAILKHKTSKNLAYGDVFDYYSFKHKEDSETGHYEPILDEFGLMQKRENCTVIALDPYGREADPEQWAASCYKTNQAHHKNNKPSDRKNHEYIISHPEADRLHMTMEDLLEEGKAFARDNLKGYDTIIAVHRDTDNDHIHITINSCRALERQEEDWMEKNDDGTVAQKEIIAGGKHRNSPEFLRHCNDWLLEYTKEHELTAEDNNAKADQHRTERYAAKNSALKNLLLATAEISNSISDFQRRLESEHQIQLIIRGKTISVLPPDRQKAIRLRTLNLDAAELLRTIGVTGREFSPDTARQELEQQEIQEQEARDSSWLRECRAKNNQIAVALLQDAEQLITESALNSGHYNVQEVTALKQVIRKITYAQRDLKTELDKLTRIQKSWMLAQTARDPQQQEKSRLYIRRCGFDPSSQMDFDELTSMQKLATLQIEHLTTQQAVLVQIASAVPPLEQSISESESSAQHQLYTDGTLDSPGAGAGAEIELEAVEAAKDHFGSGHQRWWTDSYKQAQKYLYGTNDMSPDPEQAYKIMQAEANAGNGFALHDLGKMHQTGLGCKADPEIADHYYTQALTAFLAEEQRIEACSGADAAHYLQYRIGKMYLRGYGTEQNYEQAAAWFKPAADQNPSAAYSLAGLYCRGQGVDLNNAEAIRLYTFAATGTRKSNPYAAYELGKMYRKGIGTQPDPEVANQWYSCAYQGFLKMEKDTLDDTLLYRLGQMNYKGLGTAQNISLAISYFEKSADRRNTNALYALGEIYLDADLPQFDFEKGINYLKQASELGNSFAQYRLGKMYLSGEHIEPDVHSAIRLFSSAAEQGNDMARYQLGKLLYDGHILRQNTADAIRYLEPAAEDGNTYAMTLLGKILLTEDTYKDPVHGLHLLRQAAEMGNTSAQYTLGKTLYYSRQPQLHTEAMQNLRMASANGNSFAKALLGKIILTEASTSAEIRHGIDLMLEGRSATDSNAKDLLKQIRENRKKFGEIAYHYQQLANRHIYNEKDQKEAQRFRVMWHNQLEAERYLQQQLRQKQRNPPPLSSHPDIVSQGTKKRSETVPDRKEKRKELTL